MCSGLVMLCLCERLLVNGSEPFRTVCFTNIYVIFVDATTRYLEPFQIIALLYESGLLLRVIRISVKVCIDVTLYDELFYHLHN